MSRRLPILSKHLAPVVRRSSSSCAALGFPEPTTVLFLAGLFPEPNASAAGVRTQFLVERLARTKGVEAVHFATGASKPKTDSSAVASLEGLGVQFHHVPPNRSPLLDPLLSHCCPDGVGTKEDRGHNLLVILDRFYAEEAYSFHIHRSCPHAAIVLDLQDLHSLRRHRQSLVSSRDDAATGTADPLSDLPADLPGAMDDHLLRELASIHRSDLTLVCSPVEMDALHHGYGIPKAKLCLATFFVDREATGRRMTPGFHARRDFVFVGGFRHLPNVDAIWQMKRLWPRIRRELGSGKEADDVRFHVYGPFAPRELREQCHDPSIGFHMHGWTDRPIGEILSRNRVLLAPIRFGAGIKGKIVDAWKHGTPVVTTPLGSEGMGGDHVQDWGGWIAANSQEFIEGAVALYMNEGQWRKAQLKSRELLSELYDIHHWDSVVAQLINVRRTLEERRQSDFNRSILWEQSLRSTEYFSKWIELKESLKNS